MSHGALALLMCLGPSIGLAQTTGYGRLHGKVVSGVDSSPLASAIVRISSTGTTKYMTLTDSTGTFAVDTIRQGVYLLTVRAFMYREFKDTLHLAGDSVRNLRIALSTHCGYDSVSALREIARHRPLIVENGGIAPTLLTSVDSAFEHRYGARYVILGDDASIPSACLESHNRVVFRFLDARFGNDWRRSLRKTIRSG